MSSTPPAQPINVFFSYAHKDEVFRDELAKHLKIMERQRLIAPWHDRRIAPGTEWSGQIDQHLEEAQIILLLVSADFVASDYCYDIEVQRAMDRHEAGTARVIPIIVRPCDWHSAPFGKLQALPRDGKPVTSWRTFDDAFVNVATAIRGVVQELARNP